MASRDRETFALTQVTGMNTADPPMSLLQGQVTYLQNIDLIAGGLGEKRLGSINGPTGGSEPQGGANTEIVALFRHVPNGEANGAELWAVVRPTAPGVPGFRRYSGGTWTALSPSDAPDYVEADKITFATFNRKLFIAYKSASGINRLHVWDGVTIRRVGLAPPAVAPTLASIGAGALAFTRFYRVRFTAAPGVPTQALLSEAGPSASITIAASSGVRVTRPATVDGIETSWFVEAAAAANGPWFQIGNIAIGTTTFDDTSATISTAFPAPEAGLYALPPSAKYLSVYLNQIVMTGAWETTATAGQTVPRNNRVWYTQPLHTFDISDDESIPSTLTAKFWTDVGEDADNVNGLSYPLFGNVYVTKRRQFWALIATDDIAQPFRAQRITDSVGARDFHTLAIGEDERGDPALYWNSMRGPYRLTRGGLQYLGRDLHGDAVLRLSDRAIWVPDKGQVWFQRSGSDFALYIFNVRFGRPNDQGDVRHGWALYIPNGSVSRTIYAMTLYTENPPNGEDLLPIVGGRTLTIGQVSFLWQFATVTQTDPDGGFQGIVRSAQLPLGQFLYNAEVFSPRLYAEARFGNSVTLETLMTRNFRPNGTPQTEQTSSLVIATSAPTLPVDIAAIGTFEGINWSDGEVYQVEIRDVTPFLRGFRLFLYVIPYELKEEAE